MSSPRVTWQQCDACGAEFEELDPAPRCGRCDGLLSLHHAPPQERGEALKRRLDAVPGPEALTSGVWRFAPLILPSVGGEVVSHPEGHTPLLQRQRITAFAGVARLTIKHEGRNPSGSFKDRGMTVALTQARRLGRDTVLCASTGNTAASLAAYAGQAGIRAITLVPAGRVSTSKLAQTLAYGAIAVPIDGDFDDCLRLANAASVELGWYLANSVNPFRIEGQKTIVLEMLQQLGWNAPDWIALPAGNLGNTAAFGRALEQAFALGLIDRVPRLAAIQARGAAPFADAFARGFDRLVPVHAETVATAIRIGDPASYPRAVEAIRFSKGVVSAVSDADILEAKREIDGTGIGCEPASAASIAGVRALRAAGIIGGSEHVVAVLTGHLLKDPGARADDLGQAVAPTVSALADRVGR